MTQERLDLAPVTPRDLVVVPQKHPLVASLRAHRRAWSAVRGLREIVFVLAIYSLYDATRYLVAHDQDGAISHGRAILHFEQRLSIAPEHWLNTVFPAHIALGLPADYIYATLHYVVTPAVLIWLWRRYPGSYGSARNVLAAITLVGLIGFSLLPVAPPRLLDGFVDTMAKYSHYGWWSTAGSAPRGLGGDTNQYAAMPSLHVGWALWCGWQMVRHGRHRVTKALGVAYPLVLSVVVMATANHYLLDVVAGAVVVVIGAVLAWALTAVGARFKVRHGGGPLAPTAPA